MFGVGLRTKHYTEFLQRSPRVDFVEAIAENFMGLGGRPRAVLDKVRSERPVFLHGVSLGIASMEPLDERYLASWKSLIARVEPQVVSDHLCWGRAHGRYSHDLLPVPFTREAVDHVVSRVTQVQEFLGRRIALENVSSYVTFVQSEMTEWDFVAEVVKRSGCGVLFDVNNVWVSAQNHGFDPLAYLRAIPVDAVMQFHLAGHQRRPEVIIDTHDGPVSDEVWALFGAALARFGARVPTLIEWDEGVPELSVLLAEAEKARACLPSERAGLPVAPTRSTSSSGDLAKTQSVLFSAICDPIEITDEAAALVSSKSRLELYADMYWLRMRDTLRELFPTVHRFAGDELFNGLVADLLRAKPSTHFSLDRLGANFAETMREDFRDLAALEWARTDAFVAPDASVVSFDSLTDVPAEEWPGVTLTLHPSVRLLTLDTDPGEAVRGGELNAQPSRYVVWRAHFTVNHMGPTKAEYRGLRAIQRGESLPEVIDAFDGEDDAAATALSALRFWFDASMISEVVSAPSRDERAD